MRKGNILYLVVEGFSNSVSTIHIVELTEKGPHKLGSEPNVPMSEVIDLAELVFANNKELKSVAIVFASKFNYNNPATIAPKLVITKNDNGTFKGRMFEQDRVYELINLDSTRICIKLMKALNNWRY